MNNYTVNAGHDDAVTCIAFDLHAKRAATCSLDYHVKVNRFSGGFARDTTNRGARGRVSTIFNDFVLVYIGLGHGQ